MKIGLVDVDGHNYPNLPLMKISAFHKREGDSVEWYRGLWSDHMHRVYLSKVFSFTPDYNVIIDADEVVRGGSGYAIELENGKEVYHKERDNDLPEDVEHIYPDYSIYPEYTQDTAFGFLTRGCPRGCSFCHVAAKEGQRSYKVANLDEFWKGQKNIVLNDPNILGCADHSDLLQQLIDSKAKVEFNQGLDVRLMTDKNIDLLRQIPMKYIHLAYDRIEDMNLVEPKLKAFKEATGYDYHKVMVYILVNFSSTLAEDLHRIYFCKELGFDPFVMVYDKRNASLDYKRLQRWCNNKFIFRKTERFEDYNR